MHLNKYLVQIGYSGVNWVFLLLLKGFLIPDVYSTFMYFFVYSHAIAGILNYLFAYNLLKKDYRPANARESVSILLYLFLAGIIISFVYPIWFIVFSVSFAIKEIYFRDVVKSGKYFSSTPIILYVLMSLCSVVFLSFKSGTKDMVFIMLSIINIVFSYPLVSKMSVKINRVSITWEDLSMPLISSSKNIFISEILLRALSPLGYGEFYYIRNLLGPLGQITNFVNAGVTGKSDKTSKLIFRTVQLLCLIILFAGLGYYTSTLKIAFAAIMFTIWDTLYGIVSFRLYIDENLIRLLAWHIVIIALCAGAYWLLQLSLFSTLILSFIMSASVLSRYFLKREG